MSQLRQTDYWIVHTGIQASAHAFSALTPPHDEAFALL